MVTQDLLLNRGRDKIVFPEVRICLLSSSMLRIGKACCVPSLRPDHDQYNWSRKERRRRHDCPKDLLCQEPQLSVEGDEPRPVVNAVMVGLNNKGEREGDLHYSISIAVNTAGNRSSLYY
jgi:hypothetical protein